MAATHELIEVVTCPAGGSTTTLVFSSIPATFTDLELVWSLKFDSSNYTNAAHGQCYWRVNGSTTTSVYAYAYQGMVYGSGNEIWYVGANDDIEISNGIARSDTDTSNCGLMRIYDYTATSTTGKSIQTLNSCMEYSANNYDRAMLSTSGNLNIAAAISSLAVTCYGSGAIKEDSYMRLYGIDRTA